MRAATTVLLLGCMLVVSVHGLAELNVTQAWDDGELTGTKIKPVNETFGSHRYYIPGYKLWIDAVASCAKLGGWLADIRSREELMFLQQLSKKSGDAYSHWVGAAAMGANKSFIWIHDKTKVGKEFWRPGQPIPEEGNCVFFVWNIPTPDLKVFDCNDKNKPGRGFICKLPRK